MNGIPHNFETERSLLGGMLLDSTRIPDVLAEVGVDDFSRPNHAHLYRLLTALHRRDGAVDIVSLLDEVARRDVAESLGGTGYLVALPQSCPSLENLEVYAGRVKDHAVRRRLLDACNLGIEAVEAGDISTADLLADMERRLRAVAGETERDGWTLLADDMAIEAKAARLRTEGHDPTPPIPTWLPELNAWTEGGFRPGEMIVVAARPAMGKTVVGLLLALAAGQRGHGAAIISLEMTRGGLARRALSKMAHVPLGAIRGGRADAMDCYRLDLAVETARAYPIWTDDRSAVTIEQLVGKVRKLKAKHPNLRIVIVDYLQLMQGGRGQGGTRAEEVSRISRGLKILAKDEQLVMVALAQVTRAVENRGIDDRRPTPADMKESGSIEQDADLILSPYRHEVYLKGNPAFAGKCELIILKQRDGREGTIPCDWHGDYTSIETEASRREIAIEEQEQLRQRTGEYR